jgi:excisionase family DNA binding protein
MRKIYCNVLEGVTYEDRCLFALQKVIEANPDCEDCLVRELRRFKRCEVKAVEPKPMQKAKAAGKKKPKKKSKLIEMRQRGLRQATGVQQKRSNNVKDMNVTEDIKVTKGTKDLEEFDVRSVSELLGKSIRRTQELVKEGKIPGCKVGRHWHFNKEEIEEWFRERKSEPSEIPLEMKHEGQGASSLRDEEEPKKRLNNVYTFASPAQGDEQKIASDSGGNIEGEEPGGAGNCISE